MTLVQKIILFLVTALGLAAGLPKVMRVPNEADFFQQLGLAEGALVGFGVAQIIGGLMLINPASRRGGAVLTAALFLGSAAMLFFDGQIGFGLFSLIPVALTGVVIHSAKPTRAADRAA